MPRPKQGPRLASSPAHERLMLANMATSLYRNGSVKTTLAKAKRLRPIAERLITFAKRGDQASMRRVMRVIRDKAVVHQLFTSIASEMKERHGGYTRIIHVAPRHGDAAPQAIIALVTEPLSVKQATVKEAEAATKQAAKSDAAAAPKDATAAKSEKTDATAKSTKPAAKPAAKKADASASKASKTADKK
jgi:large subunit ribosomal protein L17